MVIVSRVLRGWTVGVVQSVIDWKCKPVRIGGGEGGRYRGS